MSNKDSWDLSFPGGEMLSVGLYVLQGFSGALGLCVRRPLGGLHCILLGQRAGAVGPRKRELAQAP